MGLTPEDALDLLRDRGTYCAAETWDREGRSPTSATLQAIFRRRGWTWRTAWAQAGLYVPTRAEQAALLPTRSGRRLPDRVQLEDGSWVPVAWATTEAAVVGRVTLDSVVLELVLSAVDRRWSVTVGHPPRVVANGNLPYGSWDRFLGVAIHRATHPETWTRPDC